MSTKFVTFMKSSAEDRFYGFIIFLVGLFFAWQSWNIKVLDEVSLLQGPRGLPLAVSLLIMVFSLWLFFMPTDHTSEKETLYALRKQALFIITTLLSMLLLSKLGFIVAMSIMLTVVMWLFGAKKPILAFLAAVLISLFFYVFFSKGLKIGLPSGLIFFF